MIKDPEKRKMYLKEWRTKNKEKIKETRKIHYKENKKEIITKVKIWYSNNTERVKKRKKEYSLKNPDVIKNHDLKKYGITLEKYNELLLQQSYSCAICGKTKEENGKSLCVDHNHKSGKIRGLLCSNCNTALGLLNDDIQLLKNVIKYLKNNISS